MPSEQDIDSSKMILMMIYCANLATSFAQISIVYAYLKPINEVIVTSWLVKVMENCKMHNPLSKLRSHQFSHYNQVQLSNKMTLLNERFTWNISPHTLSHNELVIT